MAELKLPFYVKKVECPVCGAITENQVLKSKICMPDKLDTDNYVLSYTWLDKSYKECIPSFFALWVCTACGYADFPDNFESNLKNPSFDFNKLKYHIMKQKENPDNFLSYVVADIIFPEEGIDFVSAMNMHLLALYCYDVLIKDSLDYEMKGRLYLRTGWLFRDLKTYSITPRQVREFTSHQEYLASIKKYWAEVPCSEKDNITLAAYYYHEIVAKDLTFENAVRNFRSINFSSELHVRVGDYARALEIFNEVIRHGIEARQEIMQFMEQRKLEKKLTDEDKYYFQRKMDKVSNELMDIRERYTEVYQEWYKQYRTAIDKVYAQSKEATIDTVVTRLKEAGIPLGLVRVMQQKDKRLQEGGEEEKKPWEFWK